MLRTLISTQVKHNHYGYDFRRVHLRITMILALGLVTLGCKTIRLDKPVIKFAKVIGHTENFYNFRITFLVPYNKGFGRITRC